MSDKNHLFINAWGDRLPVPLAEYRFHNTRKWRFDFAWPNEKVAVEVEGNAWGVKGGGRHMQDSDLDKYNNASALGWRVFRFSPKMLKNNAEGCVLIVSMALGGVSR